MKVLAAILLIVLPCASCSPSLIGYWGCNPGGHASTVPQLQSAVQRGYNVVIFAFFDVDASGKLIQDPGAVTPPHKSSIGNFTYLVSLFGGQNGAAPTLSITPDAWAQAMYSNFQSLHRDFGFDGIDIDLENAWGGTPNNIVCGLRTFFKLMHNGGFKVSMAPQTTAVTPEVTVYQAGSWNSYAPLLDTGIIEYVDIVAVQLYNNAVPSNNVETYGKNLISGFKISGCPSCANVTGLVKIPSDKIAFGFPAGNGAAPSGCPGLPGGCPYGNALTSLYSSSVLKSTGGVMTWAIEWDEASNWQFITAAKKIW